MKWLGLLLGFYVFTLAIMPCGDGNDCSNETTVSAADDHTGHNHANETCTPFCACACCGTPSQVSTIYTIDLFVPEQPTPFQVFCPQRLSDASISIWQPPKIG